jgi:hypothetical protein
MKRLTLAATWGSRLTLACASLFVVVLWLVPLPTRADSGASQSEGKEKNSKDAPEKPAGKGTGKVSDEKLQATEKAMTPEQKKLFDEGVELQKQILVKQAGGRKSAVDEATLRKNALTYLAGLPPGDRKEYWSKTLPDNVLGMHRTLDPWYVSKEERAAAEKLPAGVAGEIEKLMGSDIDAYLDARRSLLARGPDCRALVLDQGRRLPTASSKHMRLQDMLFALGINEQVEKRLRVTEEGLQRMAALRKTLSESGNAKLVLLVARTISSSVGENPGDPYATMCIFNFARGNHDVSPEGPSLVFGIVKDHLRILIAQGQANRLRDMGDVDYASVKRAPSAAQTAEWLVPPTGQYRVVVGHVYVEHCLVPYADVDLTVKFKVLDMKPGEWAILQWEKIPQER